MLDIRRGDNGEVVLSGRFDASEAEKAQGFLDAVTGSGVLDLRNLQYISSAGLGVLIATHKRLMGTGGGLKLINVSKHIGEIFHFSGLDQVFEVHLAP